MMTYTSAHDFYVRCRLERHRHLRLDLHLHLPRSPQARHRVLMNCVDTGWVTDMAPGGVGARAATHETHIGPPLDETDGAARVLDPLFMHVA